MCDSCPYSVCIDCVSRNFGAREAKIVHRLATWRCYVCAPTPAFIAKQLNPSEGSQDVNLMNIDMAYNSARPPSADLSSIPPHVLDSLSPPEGKFLRLFTDQVATESSFGWSRLNVASYLRARDLVTLRLVSKNLRCAFQHILLCPGLFCTQYGEEHNVRLFDHQVASLSQMVALENSSDEFGALRGGILADAPGLGKTVTVLALVCSTSGLLPRRPAGDFDPEEVRVAWTERRVNQAPLLLPFVNWMKRSFGFSGEKRSSHPLLTAMLAKIQSGVECNYATIDEFKTDVYQCVNTIAYDSMQREVIKERLRHWLQETRETLGKNKRARNSSVDGQRESQERSLWPSGATLIVVPLVLLEHWFEQISRHLGLQYLVSDDHGAIDSDINPVLESLRGIVYLDGLGDIVDVQAPLEKLYVPDHIALRPEQLAQYTIVVTTVERCAKEWRLASAQGDLLNCAFLNIRWLRLVVDEGHDIGYAEEARAKHRPGDGADARDDSTRATSITPKKKKKRVSSSNSFSNGLGSTVLSNESNSMLVDSSPSTAFISFIAAERRWVMSGTPTTGSQTKLALLQLHKLLCFLRHPVYGVGERGARLWRSQVAEPFMAKEAGSFEQLGSLLKQILVRHNKEDLRLFEPIMTRMDVDALYIRVEENSDAFANFLRAAPRFYDDSVEKPLTISTSHSSGAKQESDSLDVESMEIVNMRPLLFTPETKVEAECRAKAAYIAYTILTARRQWLEAQRTQSRLSVSRTSIIGKNAKAVPAALRRPKAIVFSQTEELLGVAHYLYLMLGESHVCEHMKSYRSAELSRFRNSRRKYRICPLCGTSSGITDAFCPCTLLLVEYLDPPRNLDLPEDEADDDPESRDRLYGEGGFVSVDAARGHFVGACLCSPLGCRSSNLAFPRVHGPMDPFFHPRLPCGGWPNPLYKLGRNRALVADRDVAGTALGAEWQVGQIVFVNPAPPVANLDEILLEEKVAASSATSHMVAEAAVAAPLSPGAIGGSARAGTNGVPTKPAVLWRRGRMGGRARIVQWARCGGRGATVSWNGDK